MIDTTSDIVLHASTARALAQWTAHPGHAVLIAGPRGIGKGRAAHYLAATLLHTSAVELARQPYLKQIQPDQTGSIPIDAIRELEHFLSRKVPGDAKRIVLIEDAHSLTIEAQNALLKTLEEPPEGSVIILTASSEQSLLATVRSRAATIQIVRPEQTALHEYFQAQGYSNDTIRKNLLISGGLPGLTAALLANNTEHPLVAAATTARELIQKDTFGRLALVDVLAKQKPFCLDVVAVLQQMAHVALSGPKPSPRWQQVLESSYLAAEQLTGNAQPKLVLTKFMLSL